MPARRPRPTAFPGCGFRGFPRGRVAPTTFVDGGSSGALNFLAFREYVIRPSKSDIFAFLNVSAIGQGTDGIQGLHFYENDDEHLLHTPSALEVIEKNRDIIVGIKVRAYTGLKSLKPLKKARELADTVNLPIMVHLAPPPPGFGEVLPYLRQGDISPIPTMGVGRLFSMKRVNVERSST